MKYVCLVTTKSYQKFNISSPALKCPRFITCFIPFQVLESSCCRSFGNWFPLKSIYCSNFVVRNNSRTEIAFFLLHKTALLLPPTCYLTESWNVAMCSRKPKYILQHGNKRNNIKIQTYSYIFDIKF